MLPTAPLHTFPLNTEAISTGSLRLDLALQTGGILPGDIVEISGPPDSGKTTLCLHMAAQANRLGRLCLWLDADGLFEPSLALSRGVDPQHTLVVPPLKADASLDILARLASSEAPMLIVIDSLYGLLYASEDPLGSKAAVSSLRSSVDKLLSLTLRRISLPLQRAPISLVFTRRAASSGPAYHQLSTHLFRLAPRMHTTVRICLGNPAPFNAGDPSSGIRVPARVQRMSINTPNSGLGLSIRKKFPPCFADIELVIMYNQGIIRIGEVFDLGLQLGLIKFREDAFIVENRKLGPDRAAATAALERQGLAASIEQVIRQKLLRNEHLGR